MLISTCKFQRSAPLPDNLLNQCERRLQPPSPVTAIPFVPVQSPWGKPPIASNMGLPSDFGPRSRPKGVAKIWFRGGGGAVQIQIIQCSTSSVPPPWLRPCPNPPDTKFVLPLPPGVFVICVQSHASKDRDELHRKKWVCMKYAALKCVNMSVCGKRKQPHEFLAINLSQTPRDENNCIFCEQIEVFGFGIRAYLSASEAKNVPVIMLKLVFLAISLAFGHAVDPLTCHKPPTSFNLDGIIEVPKITLATTYEYILKVVVWCRTTPSGSTLSTSSSPGTRMRPRTMPRLGQPNTTHPAV